MSDVQARRFIESVVVAYRDLSAYRDLGAVRVSTAQVQDQELFATHFLRPSRYRFDYLSKPEEGLLSASSYHAIVSTNSTVVSYSRAFDSSTQTNEEKSIGEAIAKLTGISMGAAYVVPRLLLDSLPGTSLLEFEETEFGEDIVVSGILCKQVHCVSPIGTCTIAIEGPSRMIRRIHNRGADFEVEETRSVVQTNCAIDESLFDLPVVETLR